MSIGEEIDHQGMRMMVMVVGARSEGFLGVALWMVKLSERVGGWEGGDWLVTEVVDL